MTFCSLRAECGSCSCPPVTHPITTDDTIRSVCDRYRIGFGELKETNPYLRTDQDLITTHATLQIPVCHVPDLYGHEKPGRNGKWGSAKKNSRLKKQTRLKIDLQQPLTSVAAVAVVARRSVIEERKAESDSDDSDDMDRTEWSERMRKSLARCVAYRVTHPLWLMWPQYPDLVTSQMRQERAGVREPASGCGGRAACWKLAPGQQPMLPSVALPARGGTPPAPLPHLVPCFRSVCSVVPSC